MPFNLKLYEDDGVTPLTALTFSNVVPGTVSDPIPFRLVNDASGGAVDPAPNPYIQVLEQDPDTLEYVLQGFRGVDEHWLRGELTGVSSTDVSQLATGIEPVGRGRVLRVAELPSGGWVEGNIYYAPPQSVPSGAASTRNFALAADSQPSSAVDHGHSESSRDSILSGVGDGSITALLVGGTITPNGPADDKIDLPDLVWVHQGVPLVKLAHELTVSDQDSAAAALVASEGYWLRLSAGASATITQTKSLKFALPADPDDVPAVPAGEIDLGYILRDDTDVIDTTEITSRCFANRFELTWTSGLQVTIGAGRARVDNELIVHQARSSLTLPASEAENSIWLVPGGGLDSTDDGSKPDPRAYLLYTVATGATDVTIASLVDYRDPIPQPLPLVFNWSGTLADGDKAYAVYPSARTGYIRAPRGLIYRHVSNGSGNATGVTKVIVRIGVAGTDIFTSSGTVDRRPSIAFDASPALSTAGLPEVLELPPWSILEAEIDRTTAYDGTAPSGAQLVLLVDQS